MKIPPKIALSLLATTLISCVSCSKTSNVKTVSDLDNSRDWGIYRGDQRSNQFSSLEQINAGNVQQLEVAWTYHTGDATGGSSIQSNPIVIDGILYFVSPAGQLTALDAASGEAIWKYDPRSPEQKGETTRSLVGERLTGRTEMNNGFSIRLILMFMRLMPKAARRLNHSERAGKLISGATWA